MPALYVAKEGRNNAMPREVSGPFAERNRLKKRRDALVEELKQMTLSERSWLDEHAPALESGDPETRQEFARRLEEKYALNYELGDTEWKLGNTPDALTNLKAAYEYGSDDIRLKVVDTLRDIQTRTGMQLLSASEMQGAASKPDA
jgi:hypothetical protein